MNLQHDSCRKFGYFLNHSLLFCYTVQALISWIAHRTETCATNCVSVKQMNEHTLHIAVNLGFYNDNIFNQETINGLNYHYLLLAYFSPKRNYFERHRQAVD